MRTSGRPNGFNRAIGFLKKQTNQNFKLIVSVDDNESFNYVKKTNYDCEIVKVKKHKRQHPNHNPYNLYVNELISKVNDGWYVVIDDDDEILTTLVEDIHENCKHENSVYIFKIDFCGRLIPSYSFGHSVQFADISSSCIVMNFKNKNIAKWKPVRGGDFHYISDIVATKKLKVKWVNSTLTKITLPGSGKRKDIE